jgi:hypothetical protein
MNSVVTLGSITLLIQLALAAHPTVPPPAFAPVTSGIMHEVDPARELIVELNGAHDLYLVATYGGDSHDFDQAIWAEPMLEDLQGVPVPLTSLQPAHVQVGWGQLILNQDHQNRPLTIAEREFSHGFWAHAPSQIHFQLDGRFQRLTVWVGLTPGAVRGSVDFQIVNQPPPMPAPAEFTSTPTPAATSNTAPPPPPPAHQSPSHFNPAAAERLLAHGIERLVFVRRYTLSADHVYTEYVNSQWLPGGGLCILDLRTGQVEELLPEWTATGVVNRFDLSFDATRIAFDFKAAPDEGYRLHEASLDGSWVRPLTVPPDHEAELIARYRLGYHHGTDDMHPCYLPDGGIAFVSTRCEYSVLCDSSDNFTVSNLYRVEADGSQLRPLSNSPLSEASPVLLPDGRILYHRWEYLDKAAGNIKSLWAMNPDGTASAEVYGNDIAFPETMIYARPIPNRPGHIVMLGASHCCPNNALGTVIQIDVNHDIRSPDTMRFVTPDIHALHHNGFHFLGEDGQWIHDMTGTLGRLFKDPYPISDDLFLVAHKPPGLPWNDPRGYELCLLDGQGKTTTLYRDEAISVWHPYPLLPRPTPPVPQVARDPNLARQNLAQCLVMDVYAGLDGVPRGTIKHLRVLEQLGRPWAARKSWNDRHGQHHAHSAIGDGSLSVKLQHGIVPVEPDGSAHFFVPAMRNIYFQALDEHYRAVQTERTYVNYMPGEMRSCVGCHVPQNETPSLLRGTPLAARRPPSHPGPQPGQQQAAQVFDYDRQIQPIWDRHCLECHQSEPANAGLNLAGTHVETFSQSYHQLIELSRQPTQLLGSRSARNEDAAFLDQEAMQFLPPYSLGSTTSPLVAFLSNGQLPLHDDSFQSYVDSLLAAHPDVALSSEELIRVITWIDVNAPFHPSYWGRLNARYRDHPNYRPLISPAEAQERVVPASVQQAESAAVPWNP